MNEDAKGDQMRQQPLFEEEAEGDYEEIASIDQLRMAYKLVKGNKGAAGVDGMSVDEFGQNLESELGKIHQELRDWTYEPQPVKRVEIPKPEGGVRKLGIPTVRDRVVQQSIKISLEGRFEEGFSESSYGFRPGLGQRDAIKRAKELEGQGKYWVVDIDLEKFFDRINHDRIIHLVSQKVSDKRVLRLIGLILRSGVEKGEPVTGTPQGSPLSPLLSNIVLDELDKELETRGLTFVRYADDCNIYVGSQKAGERVMGSISRFIEEKMKLKINWEKSKVGLAKTIKFLGITIYEGMVIIAKRSIAKAMAKVQELTPRRTHRPIEKRIEAINRWYVGWANYFGVTEIPSQLKKIEAHIRRRIRSQLVGEQKRRVNLYHKLVKRGVSRRHAKSVYGSKGQWRLSHNSAVEKAWPNAWFEKIGLIIKSNCKLPHWKPIDFYIRGI